MRTLRGRLAILSTLVVALAFLATGAVIVGATGRAQTSQLERDLGERLATLENSGRGGPFGDRPRPTGRPLAGFGGGVEDIGRAAEGALGRGFFVIIRDRDGAAVTSLGDVPDADLGPTAPGQTTQIRDDDGNRYLLLTSDHDGPSLQIGADVDRLIGDGQQQLTQRVTVVGALATALTGLVTFVVAGFATRPLRRLRDVTEEVAETENLTARVDVEDAPSEILAVAEGLNTMLARLEGSTSAREAALHAARRFAADAGHEMRTPLTAMQATLDSLERNPGMDQGLRDEMVSEVSEESRRLAGLLESLQVLARADAGLDDVTAPVDLSEVVGASADAMGSRMHQLTVRVSVAGPTPLVNGSEPWLRSIVDNLLKNAALHGRRADGDAVIATVSVATLQEWVQLTVDDDGPGFPETDRDRVFERFTRGADAVSRPGSGLGMSLVAQLVALHGGQVRIGDAPNGGARVEVLLPRTRTASPEAR